MFSDESNKLETYTYVRKILKNTHLFGDTLIIYIYIYVYGY